MSHKNRHVQIDTSLFDLNKLNCSDIITYAFLKKFMDYETKTCYPSMSVISDLSKLSRNTIATSIQNLLNYGCIKIIGKKNRNNIYEFVDYSGKIENYSNDFLESTILTSKQKVFYILLQPHLNNLGASAIMHQSFVEISTLTGLDRRIISERLQELQDIGIVKVIYLSDTYKSTVYSFDLEKLNQQESYLKDSSNVDQILSDIDQLLSRLNKQFEELKKIIEFNY